MTLRRTSFLSALLAVCALNVAAFGQQGEGAAKKDQPAAGGAQGLVGKPAPDFTGKDLDGKEHKLADIKGKIAVIEWFSSQCPVCKRHVQDKKTMQSTLAKFKDKGVVWLAVDSNVATGEVSKPADIKSFAKECGVTYPIILDPDGKIGHAFGAKTTPHMFVIDKNGIIAYEGAIDNDPQGKEANPINHVEAAVQSLVDGSQVATQYVKPYGCGVKYAAPAGEKGEKKEKGSEKP